MSAHIISNPVPTPEEMGQILGLSSDRVAAVRKIMGAPPKEASPVRSASVRRVSARKKSTPARKRSRAAARR